MAGHSRSLLLLTRQITSDDSCDSAGSAVALALWGRTRDGLVELLMTLKVFPASILKIGSWGSHEKLVYFCLVWAT